MSKLRFQQINKQTNKRSPAFKDSFELSLSNNFTRNNWRSFLKKLCLFILGWEGCMPSHVEAREQLWGHFSPSPILEIQGSNSGQQQVTLPTE